MAVWIKRLLFAFLVGLLGVLANLTPPGLQMEEDFGLPWLFRLRGATPAPPEVVVVAIDKASSSQLGLPTMPSLWPRDVHARLINKLSSNSAKVIAFDLRFDTPGAAAQHDETRQTQLQRRKRVDSGKVGSRGTSASDRPYRPHICGRVYGKDRSPSSCHR